MAMALITGANRGLGLEAARQLVARGWEVVLACRDRARGEAAARGLGGAARAVELDVGDPTSVAALGDALAADGVTLDALVGNAAVALDGFDARVARDTLAVNLHGALAVVRAIAPRVRDGGAIVLVSSAMGQLSVLGEPARGRVARVTTVVEVEALGADFVAAVAEGTHAGHGWPSSAYSVSKALLNAAVRALAIELGPRVRVNAVCPGWARTDMGGRHAPRSAEQGGASIVAAVLEPRATGGFFRDGEALPW